MVKGQIIFQYAYTIHWKNNIEEYDYPQIQDSVTNYVNVNLIESQEGVDEVAS